MINSRVIIIDGPAEGEIKNVTIDHTVLECASKEEIVKIDPSNKEETEIILEDGTTQMYDQYQDGTPDITITRYTIFRVSYRGIDIRIGTIKHHFDNPYVLQKLDEIDREVFEEQLLEFINTGIWQQVQSQNRAVFDDGSLSEQVEEVRRRLEEMSGTSNPNRRLIERERLRMTYNTSSSPIFHFGNVDNNDLGQLRAQSEQTPLDTILNYERTQDQTDSSTELELTQEEVEFAQRFTEELFNQPEEIENNEDR